MTDFGKGYFDEGVGSRFTEENYTYEKELPNTTLNADAILRNFPGPFSVLDYGCGKGFLVRYLDSLGLDASGYDVSEYSVEHCDPVVEGKLTSSRMQLRLMLEEHTVDVVASFYTFEHLTRHDLVETLQSLMDYVRWGFVFTVPLRSTQYNWKDDFKYLGDATHQLIETAQWWEETVSDALLGFALANYYVTNCYEGLRRGTFVFLREDLWKKDKREEYPITAPDLTKAWRSNQQDECEKCGASEVGLRHCDGCECLESP